MLDGGGGCLSQCIMGYGQPLTESHTQLKTLPSLVLCTWSVKTDIYDGIDWNPAFVTQLIVVFERMFDSEHLCIDYNISEAGRFHEGNRRRVICTYDQL